VKQGADGRQTNTLGVQMQGDNVIFTVNGTGMTRLKRRIAWQPTLDIRFSKINEAQGPRTLLRRGSLASGLDKDPITCRLYGMKKRLKTIYEVSVLIAVKQIVKIV
jgi:hypothetical protein